MSIKQNQNQNILLDLMIDLDLAIRGALLKVASDHRAIYHDNGLGIKIDELMKEVYAGRIDILTLVKNDNQLKERGNCVSKPLSARIAQTQLDGLLQLFRNNYAPQMGQLPNILKIA